MTPRQPCLWCDQPCNPASAVQDSYGFWLHSKCLGVATNGFSAILAEKRKNRWKEKEERRVHS